VIVGVGRVLLAMAVVVDGMHPLIVASVLAIALLLRPTFLRPLPLLLVPGCYGSVGPVQWTHRLPPSSFARAFHRPLRTCLVVVLSLAAPAAGARQPVPSALQS